MKDMGWVVVLSNDKGLLDFFKYFDYQQWRAIIMFFAKVINFKVW